MPTNNNNWFAAPKPAIGIGAYLIFIVVISIYFVFKFFPGKDFNNTPVDKEIEVTSPLNDSTIIKGTLSSNFAPEFIDTVTLDLQIQESKNKSTIAKVSSSIPIPQNKLPNKILLFLIILVGAIGASIHGITSLAEYVGNQKFKEQWTIWYLLRPFVGALLAFIFYLFLRGGLFKVENTTSDLYGILAIAGLIGMFSKQALYKISDIVDVIFLSTKEQFLKNKLVENLDPKITEIIPKTFEVNSENRKFTLIGTNFINEAKVFAGNTELKTVFDSSTQISAELNPEQLTKEGELEIKVVNPDSGGVSSSLILITPKKKERSPMTYSEIYIPEQLEKKKKEILDYYKNETSFEKAKEFIYGGKDMRELVSHIGFEIVDQNNLLVNIELKKIDGQVAIIKNISFRQLTLESSNNYLETPKKGWENLASQQRLEICQQELSRWSLILKTKEFLPSELEFINTSAFDHIELINNCTTNEGFELKIMSNGVKYHGSFSIPSDIYFKLCTEQAGSWAKQGWMVDWENTSGPDEDHGLIDPHTYPDKKANPTFGQVYWEAVSHARDIIRIDLSIYRKTVETIFSGTVNINYGEIKYDRWSAALGADNEYVTKPKVRKLISSSSKNEYINHPESYGDILSGKYEFRLPLFLENGLYDVTEAKEKNHYHQLTTLVSFEISELENGLHELVLFSNAFDKTKRELSKIVIGNINLANIPFYPNIQTIDRFCFAPRDTEMKYDHQWMPSSIKEKQNRKAPYAFLLSGEENVFIQAENWGIERAIFSKEDEKTIIIDLISYERIVPVWQGKIVLGKVMSDDVA